MQIKFNVQRRTSSEKRGSIVNRSSLMRKGSIIFKKSMKFDHESAKSGSVKSIEKSKNENRLLWNKELESSNNHVPT